MENEYLDGGIVVYVWIIYLLKLGTRMEYERGGG